MAATGAAARAAAASRVVCVHAHGNVRGCGWGQAACTWACVWLRACAHSPPHPRASRAPSKLVLWHPVVGSAEPTPLGAARAGAPADCRHPTGDRAARATEQTSALTTLHPTEHRLRGVRGRATGDERAGMRPAAWQPTPRPRALRAPPAAACLACRHRGRVVCSCACCAGGVWATQAAAAAVAPPPHQSGTRERRHRYRRSAAHTSPSPSPLQQQTEQKQQQDGARGTRPGSAGVRAGAERGRRGSGEQRGGGGSGKTGAPPFPPLPYTPSRTHTLARPQQDCVAMGEDCATDDDCCADAGTCNDGACYL